MNYSKEQEVCKVVNDPDGIKDYPIPERRPDPGTPIRNTMGTGFHTFTLNNINISS